MLWSTISLKMHNSHEQPKSSKHLGKEVPILSSEISRVEGRKEGLKFKTFNRLVTDEDLQIRENSQQCSIQKNCLKMMSTLIRL